VRRALSLLAFLLVAAFRHADAQTADQDGWYLRADWLQASAIKFDRSTMPSADVALEWRVGSRAVEFGYLRAVRKLSTVQGAYATLARPMRWGPTTVVAGIGIFGGQAAASADSTGYNYIDGGVSGHQPRYSYSTGASFGGGVQLALEMPLGGMFGFRASVAEWAFSGHPVQGDNARFLAGVGLSLKFPQKLSGLKALQGNVR
jgi:hypothetical protein